MPCPRRLNSPEHARDAIPSALVPILDETGTSTKMTRLRARCPKGQRLYAKAPFGHWKTQTFVAGLRSNELCAPGWLTGR